MGEPKKQVHFEVQQALWESFYRVFPGRGERTRMLIEFMKEAVYLQKHRNYFRRMVVTNIAVKEEENARSTD